MQSCNPSPMTTRGENILDLVMSDVPGTVSTTTQPPLGRSDHAVVIADFQLTASVDQPTTRTVWRYQLADWPRLSAFLWATDWDTIIGDDPNISCELLTMRITEGMQRFIPSKVFKTRPQDPIWWTPECSAAADRKRNAWRKSRDDPRNGALKCIYKLACLDSTSCPARAKAKHLEHVKQRLRTGSLQDRGWWSVITRVGGHGRDSSIPVLVDPDGMETTKSHDKANVIGKYFAQKCSQDDDFAEQSGPFPHVRRRTANTLATVYFRESTARRTLRALNPSKATGPDAVPARVLRKCADSLALPLSKLFTLCFCSGHQPAMWKVANVVTVHKKGPKSNPRIYRPISLLPIMSKCMGSIVNCSLSNCSRARSRGAQAS